MSIFVKTEIIVFKKINYQEICDGEVLGHAQEYGSSEIYNYLYDRFKLRQDFKYTDFVAFFQTHFSEVETYFTELKKIKDIMTQEALILQRQSLFREQLWHLYLNIASKVSYQVAAKEWEKASIKSIGNSKFKVHVPVSTISESTFSFKQQSFNEGQISLLNSNYNYFVERLYFDLSRTDLEEIKETIKAPLVYALKEVEAPSFAQDPYFKKEICALETMLPQAIVFML